MKIDGRMNAYMRRMALRAFTETTSVHYTASVHQPRFSNLDFEHKTIGITQS